MTNKEYFDLLVETSKAGGFPSWDGRSCMMFGPQGRKDPVGLIMPEELFQAQMDRLNVLDLFEKFPGLYVILPDDMSFYDLYYVQRHHDCQAWCKKWDHNEFLQSLLMMPCFAHFRGLPNPNQRLFSIPSH